MESTIPRISVLVITYKQEDVIGRTLDSLIAQKDYLYEICVSDDCSPDGTWPILIEYQNRFPDLIKLHRNERNVGIFENFECSWTMPTGEVINQVSGDDTTPDGWYKTVVNFILDNHIDYKNELFCIYGDFKAVYPNGDTLLFRQSAIQKRPYDALPLALRGIIGGRGCCYSVKVLEEFVNVSQGHSHIAEMAQDRQLQCFTEKNYYIPKLANIYYAGIGVSSRLNENTLKERQQIIPYALQFFNSKGIVVRNKDIYFLNYIRASLDFRYHKRIKSLFKALYFFLKSFDFRYNLLGNDMRYYSFVLRRRLPHRRPINM